MRRPEPPSADYLAKQWQRLHAWSATAARAFDRAPQHVGRGELALLLGWLYIMEAMLRRLVLIAASNIILTARPAPPRRSYTRKTVERRCKVSFRLIAFHRHPHNRRARAAHGARHAASSSAPTRTFLAWKTDPLLTARNHFDAPETTDPHPRHATRPHLMPQSYDGPLIPPYEPRDASAPAHPPAQHPAQQQQPAQQPRDTTTPLAIFFARLQHVAGLIAAPDALIQRTARRLARLSEAERFTLAQCPPPHPQARMRAFTGHFLPIIDAHFKSLPVIGLHANTS